MLSQSAKRPFTRAGTDFAGAVIYTACTPCPRILLLGVGIARKSEGMISCEGLCVLTLQLPQQGGDEVAHNEIPSR